MKATVLPLTALFLAALATGCRTMNNIAPHYVGAKTVPLRSSESIEVRKQPTTDKISVEAHVKSMKGQGYLQLGHAAFTAEVTPISQIKDFAASIGADLVEVRGLLIGASQRSYMGVASYTPGSTVTKSESMFIGGAYGTSVSSTYIPPEITYAPRPYKVTIADQLYFFWMSPAIYLRNWKNTAKELNDTLPPDKKLSEEAIRLGAAMYARDHNLPLPDNLRPKGQIPSKEETAKTDQVLSPPKNKKLP
jgi:hypothetical protein